MRSLILLFVLLTAPAQAAEFNQLYAPYCGPQATMCISISGEIEFRDEKKFERAMFGMPEHTPVFFDSPGGNVLAGLYIAGMIQENGFDTVVADDVVCASMCAAIWLVAPRRFIAPNGHVGFHAPSVDGQSRAYDGIRLMRKYYELVGLRPDAIDVLLRAGPQDMIWLNEKWARKLGIVALDWPPPAPASPPPHVAAKPAPQPYPHQDTGRLQNGTEVPLLDPHPLSERGDLSLDPYPLAAAPKPGNATCDKFGCVGPVEKPKPKISIASPEPIHHDPAPPPKYDGRVPQESPPPKYDGRVPQESPSFEPHYEPNTEPVEPLTTYDPRPFMALVLVLGFKLLGIIAYRLRVWIAKPRAIDAPTLPPPLPPLLSHTVGCAAVVAALEAVAAEAVAAALPIQKPNPRSPWYVAEGGTA